MTILAHAETRKASARSGEKSQSPVLNLSEPTAPTCLAAGNGRGQRA